MSIGRLYCRWWSIVRCKNKMCVIGAPILSLYPLTRQGVFKGTKEMFKNLERSLTYFKLMKMNPLALESIKAKV